jgi:hypothetical protein
MTASYRSRSSSSTPPPSNEVLGWRFILRYYFQKLRNRL